MGGTDGAQVTAQESQQPAISMSKQAHLPKYGSGEGCRSRSGQGGSRDAGRRVGAQAQGAGWGRKRRSQGARAQAAGGTSAYVLNRAMGCILCTPSVGGVEQQVAQVPERLPHGHGRGKAPYPALCCVGCIPFTPTRPPLQERAVLEMAAGL